MYLIRSRVAIRSRRCAGTGPRVRRHWHRRLRPRPTIKGEERHRTLRKRTTQANHVAPLRRWPLIRHAENRVGEPTLEVRVVAELLEQLRVVLEEAYDDTL